MATIVFGMMQSLDGYVAGVEGELEPPLHSPGPGVALIRYWIDHVRALAGSLYGRRMGRGSAGVGHGGTRIRNGLADAAEMGRITFANVGRPQCDPRRRRSRSVRSPAEERGR